MGLPLSSLAVMAGIVWAANPGSTGWIGILAGGVLAIAGVLGAIRAFKP